MQQQVKAASVKTDSDAALAVKNGDPTENTINLLLKFEIKEVKL